MPNGSTTTRWRGWLLVCCCGSVGLWGTSIATQVQAAPPFPTLQSDSETEIDSELQGFHSHGSTGLWRPGEDVEAESSVAPEAEEKDETPAVDAKPAPAPQTAPQFPAEEIQTVAAEAESNPVQTIPTTEADGFRPATGRSNISLLGSGASVSEVITTVGHTEGPTLVAHPDEFIPVPQRKYVPDPFRMSQAPAPMPAPAPAPSPPPPAAPPTTPGKLAAPAPAPAPAPVPEPLFSPEVMPEPLPYDGFIPENEPVSPMFDSILGMEDGVHYFPNPTEVFADGAIIESGHAEHLPFWKDPCSPWYKLFRPFVSHPVSDSGIGHERVMFAPFYIEPARPQNLTGLRIETGTDLYYPDRAELFWASPGRGPTLPEVEVDYQDVILDLTSGSDSFSMTTEIPIRYIDPVVNPNTVGLGDISIATKRVMIDGDRWTVSRYFKTILPTGSKSRGLGTGHLSMEPGLLASLKWTERTFLFGEIRYLFALGGNSTYAGQRLRYGLGVSTIAYETDEFAILPTLEVSGWSVLDGSKTTPLGATVNVGSETAPIVTHGLRFVLGPAGDLGLFEFGLSTSFALNDEGLFSTLGQVDLRFVY